ncbi:hypothetical protein, partial [Pseudomonas aeruginosa]|uniref:hypothetical protein n=1 Tax=Pseudomonas aeruginosa TaxID=287 RepID=UPI003D80077B
MGDAQGQAVGADQTPATVVQAGAGGEISSDRAFTLAAASLDNRGGPEIGAPRPTQGQAPAVLQGRG